MWLGGHPAQSERTAEPVPSLFKMKLQDLEATFEPIFAMYRAQRATPDEAFGNFCHRVGIPAIEAYMEAYTPGSYKQTPDQFAPALLEAYSSIVIQSALLANLKEEATSRGVDAATRLDAFLREALDLDEE